MQILNMGHSVAHAIAHLFLHPEDLKYVLWIFLGTFAFILLKVFFNMIPEGKSNNFSKHGTNISTIDVTDPVEKKKLKPAYIVLMALLGFMLLAFFYILAKKVFY
jgi:hypothetical protein